MDVDDDLPIAGFDPIPGNAIIDLAALHTRNLNIRANKNPWIVQSVLFGYDGNDEYQYESAWPYPLAGNEAGYNAWTPYTGTHTVTATAYSDTGAGTTVSLVFTVKNNSDNNINSDVNGDSGINIIDALLTAQYYVGLNPSGFNSSFADVDCDNDIDIVDALLVAQFCVGLIGQLC